MDHQHHGKTLRGFLHRGMQGWDVLAALRPRVIPGAVRLALLVAVTTFTVGLMVGSMTTSSYGVDMDQTQALPRVAEVDVVLVPGWSWSDVSVRDGKVFSYAGVDSTLDPAQPALIGSVATGDVKDIVRAVQLGSRDDARTGTNDVHVRVLPKGSTREQSLSKVRIVMGVTLSGQPNEIRPIVLQGLQLSGSLASSSTRRPGIVDLTDISPTVQSMQSGQSPVDAAEPLRLLERDDPATAALHTGTHVRFYDNHRGEFIALYVAVQVAAYAYAWFRRKGTKPTRFVPGLATAIAAVPLASLLTQWLFLHKSPHAVTWSASFLVILGIIVGMSGLASRGKGITVALRRVLAATMFVLIADVLTGGRLQLGGFFGSSPALGARYYGLGNTASVLLVVATVLWASLHVRAGEGVGAHAKRAAWWRSVALATVVAFVIGTPGLGSDVGGLFTAAVVFTGLFCVLWSTAGTVRPARIALIGSAGLVLVALAAVVDAQRPAVDRTHLGRLAARMADEGLAPLFDTVGHKLHANFLEYGFPWSILLTAVAVALLVRLLQGGWAGALPLHSSERIGAIAALVGGGLAYGVNDSGIVTLALVAVFLGPFLMVSHWCNRWNIPKLEVFSP